MRGGGDARIDQGLEDVGLAEADTKLIKADGSVVAESDWFDDGNEVADGQAGQSFDLSLTTRVAEAGVYRLSLVSTSDITWTNLATNATKSWWTPPRSC